MVIQSLDGVWELKEVGKENCIKAQVPGCVHLDLMRAKVIPDPFYGDNERKVTWVHETDWEYSRSFRCHEDILPCQRVYLECDGLDTLAEIRLNGHKIATTDNMYVAYRFDVANSLAPGDNRISIKFKSPVNYVKPLLAKDSLHSPGDSIPGSIYTRKSPSQWGWDWGPKLPSSGIWRPIRLVGANHAFITDLRVRQENGRNGKVTIKVEVEVERISVWPCYVVLNLKHPDGTSEVCETRVNGSKARYSISIQNPQLWWPNGYGKQPLYDLTAVLMCEGEEQDRKSRRVGIRTIKLEQRKDSYGRSFTFVVNGVPVFCKGANWIPADQFPPRITDAHYEHLISSAARANMNMLRVWGGGYYEDERFYDLCDEYGILVWQDFTFSCGMYPVDEAYLENVRREIEFNVKRLRGRACLALWCGNNEMEWFMVGAWGVEKSALRKRQYSKIFHDLLPSLVSRLDPDVAYWPSSPYSGEPFNDPNGPASGDGHYWEVWHGRQPFTAYRTQFHRFMSEFGFESLPAIETVKSFCPDSELNMFSHTMECHQKNSAGNGLILHYLAQTFRMPCSFEMTCYVSQLLQAEAMRYGVEHWRRNRGRCMGALYWQLNDCWPVCSWSSIDYFGRWKALHYFARRFYEPILLSVAEEGTAAEIHVTNDTTHPARVELCWSLETLSGKVLRKSKVKTKVDGGADKLLAKLDFTDELAGDAARQAVLVSELIVNGKPTSVTMTSFVPPKHLDLPKAKLWVEPGSDEEGVYIDVSADAVARYTCLVVPKRDVVFSDNYFDIPAGRTVRIRVETPTDASALTGVKAFSLCDSY